MRVRLYEFDIVAPVELMGQLVESDVQVMDPNGFETSIPGLIMQVNQGYEIFLDGLSEKSKDLIDETLFLFIRPRYSNDAFQANRRIDVRIYVAYRMAGARADEWAILDCLPSATCMMLA